MEHNISLITTLAAGFGVALILGFVAERVKLPALVGYLVAGILIGPATPGFVADMHLAAQLSEIGVMLLMFGVGLHFSLGDLLAVKRIAVPGAVVQMTCATLLGLGVLMWKTGNSFLESGETTAQLTIPKAPFIYGMSVFCFLTGLVHLAFALRPGQAADEGEGGTL